MQGDEVYYSLAQKVENTSGGKILLIDDDARALEARSSNLRREGHEVRALASLPESLSCLESEHFDLIVVKLAEGPNGEGERSWSVRSRFTAGGMSSFWHAVSVGFVLWMWPTRELWTN